MIGRSEVSAEPLIELVNKRGKRNFFISLRSGAYVCWPFEWVPELSAALVQRRKDQRSARIASIRAILEAQLQRPGFRWKDAFEANGIKRSSIEKQYPDLVPLIESKNKASLEKERLEFSNVAKNNVRLVVQQLLNRGIEPSINLVWEAIPRLPHHGKTMVEKMLRMIRTEGTGSLNHNPLAPAE